MSQVTTVKSNKTHRVLRSCVSEELQNWIDELDFMGIDPEVGLLKEHLKKCPDLNCREAIFVRKQLFPHSNQAY